MNEDALVRDYKTIKEEYAYNPDIFSLDDDRVARVKYIIDNKLNQVDKTIILLYADCGSLRKLGKRMGMSHMTIAKEIKRIKKHILEEYENTKLYQADNQGGPVGADEREYFQHQAHLHDGEGRN